MFENAQVTLFNSKKKKQPFNKPDVRIMAYTDRTLPHVCAKSFESF